MNIFEYEGKEFDEKLDEIFDQITSSELKKELIECGLVINDAVYIKSDIEKVEYSNKLLIKKVKPKVDEEYNYTNKNTFKEGNMVWKKQKLLVA